MGLLFFIACIAISDNVAYEGNLSKHEKHIRLVKTEQFVKFWDYNCG